MRTNKTVSLALLLVGIAASAACSKAQPPAAPATTAPAASTEGSAAPAEGTAAPTEGTVAVEGTAAAPTPEPDGDTCARALPLGIAPDATVSAFGSLAGKTNSYEAMVPATGYAWTGADVFYKVDLDAMDILEVAVGDNGTFDSGAYVFSDCADPAGSVLGGADTDSAVNHFEVQVPAAGTYYIAVDAYQGAMQGDYVLIANRRPNNPTGALLTPGDTCETAPTVSLPLRLGAMFQGNTNAHEAMVQQTGFAWNGVDHFYAFDLQAGQTIHVNVDDTNSVDAGWYVFRDCANIAGSAIAGADSGSDDQITNVTVTEAGRYYLAVDTYDAATSGFYSVLVY